MSFYTKEQFEEYKGIYKFLTVEYIFAGDWVTKNHETYEDYLEFYNSFCNPNTDFLKPNALPKVVERTASDRWDNAIREFGVGNASEWFGYSFDGAFAQDTVETLQERYEESLK